MGASILALVISPTQALGIMFPLLLMIDTLALRPFWKQWDWGAVRILIIGALPGVALGGVFFTIANDDAIRLMIGIMSLVYVATQLPKFVANSPRPRRTFPTWIGWISGCVCGFGSCVSHAGGPTAAIYLLSLGQPKTVYQASSVLLFWAVNVFKAVPYGVLGIFSVETLKIDLILVPFAILGTYLGVWLHRRIPERPFFMLTFALLLVTGTKLVWDALT